MVVGGFPGRTSESSSGEWFQQRHLHPVAGATGMDRVKLGTSYDAAIDAHADAGAAAMKRGPANIEDQFRSALAVLEGLK